TISRERLYMLHEDAPGLTIRQGSQHLHVGHGQRGPGPHKINVIVNECLRVTALQGNHHLVNRDTLDSVATGNGEHVVARAYDDLPAGNTRVSAVGQGPFVVYDSPSTPAAAHRALNGTGVGVSNKADLISLLARDAAHID